MLRRMLGFLSQDGFAELSAEEDQKAPDRMEEDIAHEIGACQNFAWLMIETLRRSGFAARFVSGSVVAPRSMAAPWA